MSAFTSLIVFIESMSGLEGYSVSTHLQFVSESHEKKWSNSSFLRGRTVLRAHGSRFGFVGLIVGICRTILFDIQRRFDDSEQLSRFRPIRRKIFFESSNRRIYQVRRWRFGATRKCRKMFQSFVETRWNQILCRHAGKSDKVIFVQFLKCHAPPMHGPACPSTPTQIPWLVTCRTWDYTILLLCITKSSIQTRENLERLKLKKLVVFLDTKDFIPFLFRGHLTKKCALLFGSFFSWSISFNEMFLKSKKSVD